MKRTIILTILDGWGIGEPNESNPIYKAGPAAVDFIKSHYPALALQASGIAVGLPWEEEGNSEVGHLTIGAGKILYQNFPRILLAIRDGSFFEQEFLKKAFDHARKNNSAVHLVGLLTSGNIHASFEHLAALVQMAKKESTTRLYLQLFTDGRDSPPHEAPLLLKKLRQIIVDAGVGVMASLTGRYYGMERDGHWDRTLKAYEILTGQNPAAYAVRTPEEAVKNIYARNLNDEFVDPTIIEFHPIQDNDAVIFFNFREDSVRQITEPFLNPNFSQFPAKKFNNLCIVTMTQYHEKFPADVAFPTEMVANPLGKVLADNGKTQLRIAETDKYAHVTFFFNGLNERPFPEEYRVLIPSRSVLSHDEHPEMMASAITDRALIAINEGGFDFILMNYANPDIIAHTGNYEATIAAIKAVDKEVDRLFKAVTTQNHILLITSDHGNAEVLIDPKTGEAETKHNISPVPFYLVANELKRNKTAAEVRRAESETGGLLSDIAPTVLELMKLPKPKEMTGQSLMNQLL